MSAVSPARREAAARAVMKEDGFEFSGESLVAEAEADNPRALKWVRIADAVLAARPKRKRS
jgi:hypothetical protein